jgi:hypothetical protein
MPLVERCPPQPSHGTADIDPRSVASKGLEYATEPQMLMGLFELTGTDFACLSELCAGPQSSMSLLLRSDVVSMMIWRVHRV